MTTTIERAQKILDDLGKMLAEKNASYGDSAADPLRVFARGVDAETGIRVRIDDKLSRLARGSEYPGDDTILDLAGYLILLLAVRGRQSVAEEMDATGNDCDTCEHDDKDPDYFECLGCLRNGGTLGKWVARRLPVVYDEHTTAVAASISEYATHMEGKIRDRLRGQAVIQTPAPEAPPSSGTCADCDWSEMTPWGGLVMHTPTCDMCQRDTERGPYSRWTAKRRLPVVQEAVDKALDPEPAKLRLCIQCKHSGLSGEEPPCDTCINANDRPAWQAAP